MTYLEAIRFLYGLEHGAVKLGLERIEAAVSARGHPERRYACVHVAGTNGKGSTCALLDAILSAAGYRTGLLTSPHLLDFRERIRISGALAGRDEIASGVARLRPLIERLRLSFFEATTLLAFEIFAHRGVEAAVIEVGMGGRLDATNVVRPALTIVTGIDFDHTQALGRSRSAIAGEKAGIVKAGVPLLIGPCPAPVRAVFAARTAEAGSELVRRERRAAAGEIVPAARGTRYRRISMDEGQGAGEGLERRSDERQRARPGGKEKAAGEPRFIRLRGDHQVANALLAEEAAVILAGRGFAIPPEARALGLSRACWPGRFQVVKRAGVPLTVLDVAHNPQGGGTLVEAWKRWLPAAGTPLLVVGMLGDKDRRRFLERLRPLSGRLCLIPLDSPRAGRMEALIAAAREAGFRPRACADIGSAFALARGAPVLVTGSFHTVEAGMRHLGMRSEARIFPAPARARTRPRARNAPAAGRRAASASPRGGRP